MKEIRELWSCLLEKHKDIVIDKIMKEYPNLRSSNYVRQSYFIRSNGDIPADRINRIEEIVADVLKSQRNDLDKLLNTRKKTKTKKLQK